MSGAKILAVLDKDGMRDAQGINGGKTSPLEPTINGATYKDSELDIVIKAENGLELLKKIEATIDRGIMSKQYLNTIQRPLSELSTNKELFLVILEAGGMSGNSYLLIYQVLEQKIRF